jgi:heat shock protein HtpX
MTPPTAFTQPVLVYNRIAQNRRKTVLLVAVSILVLVPFIVAISYLVSYGIVRRVSPPTTSAHQRLDREEAYYREMRSEVSADYRAEYDARVDRLLAKRRAELAAKDAAEDPNLLLKMMLLIGTGVTAALGLFFWAIAKSPTSKLLNEAGALPAGSGDIEAVRLLENLSIGAGLPPPKLYIIETDTPNAFAAGMHPEHAVVAVTRGTLKLLDRRELEGVLAHELSHIGNRDIRLNTIATSITLFLRIPYLLFRRNLAATWSRDFGNESRTTGFSFMRRSLRLTDLALSPLAVYILVVAPVLGTIVRAAISREREFLADADAALLTRFPEGIMCALAKIGGAGSGLAHANPAFSHFYFANPSKVKSWFSNTLLATHPRIEDRIGRLVTFAGGAVALPALKAAVREGQRYTKERAALEPIEFTSGAVRDELASLNAGNPLGRVFRLVSTEPVPVYEEARSGIRPMIIARVNPGALIVVFDYAGTMRQIHTAKETLGYIERSVKLVLLDNVLPAEVYDPLLRAAVEAKLPPLDVAAMRADAVAAEARSKTLSNTELFVVASIVFLIVLMGVLALLVKFGK